MDNKIDFIQGNMKKFVFAYTEYVYLRTLPTSSQGESNIMNITFWKLTGAGNDFVGLNNSDNGLPEDKLAHIVRLLCDRRFGVGADGVLIIEQPNPGSRANFTMRYFNADGSEVETCGNGARCIARFANYVDIAPADMVFDTRAGEYHAVVDREKVTIDLPPVELPRLDLQVETPEFNGTVDFINTGVPHIVIFVDDIDNAPVVRVGRALRYHAEFDPPGTNVNFVQSLDKHSLLIRTYERGVEDETLACGTGSLAAAICLVKRNRGTVPVNVKTRSGIVLSFGFRILRGKVDDVEMSGPAEVVFQGSTDTERLESIFPPGGKQ